MARGYNRITGKPTWHGTKYRKKAARTRAKNKSFKLPKARINSFDRFVVNSIINCIFR